MIALTLLATMAGAGSAQAQQPPPRAAIVQSQPSSDGAVTQRVPTQSILQLNSAYSAPKEPFLALTEAQRTLVLDQYKIAADYCSNQQWGDAVAALKKVHAALPTGYNDSLYLANLSREMIEVENGTVPPVIKTPGVTTGQKLTPDDLEKKKKWLTEYNSLSRVDQMKMRAATDYEIDRISEDTYKSEPKDRKAEWAAIIEAMKRIERLPGVKSVELEEDGWINVIFMDGVPREYPFRYEDPKNPRA